MTKYRIKQIQKDMYIIQRKCWLGWFNPMSDAIAGCNWFYSLDNAREWLSEKKKQKEFKKQVIEEVEI